MAEGCRKGIAIRVNSDKMMEYSSDVEDSFPEIKEESDIEIDVKHDDQVVPVPECVEPTTLFVQRKTADVINQQQVKFKCSFQFKPEMLQYYYSPGPDGYRLGQPVLLDSPEFEAGFKSKWQISVTINRWVDTQRWMSLYLTHLEDSSPSDMKVQCEFMVVDTEGNVLHSHKNRSVSMEKGSTSGMARFLNFHAAKRMMTDDNCILIFAHLTLESKPSLHDLELTDNISNSSNTTASTVIVGEVQKTSCLSSYLSMINYDFRIKEDERVMLFFKNEPVIALSRSLLKERSQTYACCLKEWPGCKDQLNFDYICGEDEYIKRILREYGFYIQEGYCKTLEVGSYQDIHLLLMFAKKMESADLALRCITAMGFQITPCNAPMHAAAVVSIFNEQIDQDDLHSFREYFKQNLNLIRNTVSFKKLLKKYHKKFAEFAFSPGLIR